MLSIDGNRGLQFHFRLVLIAGRQETQCQLISERRHIRCKLHSPLQQPCRGNCVTKTQFDCAGHRKQLRIHRRIQERAESRKGPCLIALLLTHARQQLGGGFVVRILREKALQIVF